MLELGISSLTAQWMDSCVRSAAVMSVWGQIVTRHCADRFEMQRSSQSLCCLTGTNILLKVSYTSHTDSEKKRSDLQSPGMGEGELDEGGQKAQSSSCRTGEYWGMMSSRSGVTVVLLGVTWESCPERESWELASQGRALFLTFQ